MATEPAPKMQFMLVPMPVIEAMQKYFQRQPWGDVNDFLVLLPKFAVIDSSQLQQAPAKVLEAAPAVEAPAPSAVQ